MAMTFNSGYSESYTTTITRAVGPTTQTGVRGTFPQAAPDDANSIWLATNGNDGNPGTAASPVLTVSQAILLLGGAKTTVHIFRNGATGDLEFTSTALAAGVLNVGHNIQVEDGEIATFNYEDGLVMRGTNKINGIHFNCSNTGGTVTALTWAAFSSLTLEIENCQISVSADVGDVEQSIRGDLSVIDSPMNLQYCIFYSNYGIVDGCRNGSTYNNCVFVASNNIKTPAIPGSIPFTSQGVHFANQPAEVLFRTTTLTRCIFSGTQAAIIFANIPQSTTPGHVLNCSDLHISNATYVALTSYYVSGSTTHYVNINFDYSLLNATNNTLQQSEILTSPDLELDPTNTVMTVSNQIDVNTVPLYQSELDGSRGDADGWRLQFAGKATPGGDKYFIDSPLIGVGLAGVDVDPWDESTAIGSRAYSDSIILEWPSEAVNVEEMFTNPIEITDPNGNIHTDYDAIRKKFTFNFPDSTFNSNDQIWKMRQLFSDKSVKQWFPLGIGESLFDDSSSGIFSDVDNSFAPNFSLNFMIPNHWAGFWITIGGNDFYISDNDEDKLFLIDKLSNTFPANGNHSFTVEYMLVQRQIEALQYNQPGFTVFLKGGKWRENTDTQTQYQYRGGSFSIMEVEDPDEGAQ